MSYAARGEIRITPYGKPSVCLFPQEGEKNFYSCTDPHLAELVTDLFDALRAGVGERAVHGVPVEVTLTQKGKKTVAMTVAGYTIRLLEVVDPAVSRALLFLELPFEPRERQTTGAETPAMPGGGWV